MPTLDFKGKQFVYSHHLSVPFRELKIVADKSLPGDGGPSLDDNLIIHGDNLDALKALLPKYAGKVDVIYIDPPYNTGNEGWAYNDNVNSPLMKEWLGEVVDGDDLERHDKWLSMMWPRLVLLRELLSEGGIIWVTLDDNEASHTRCILDEIFEPHNFLANISWVKRYTRSNNAKKFYSQKDQILVYRKSDQVSEVKEPRSAKADEGYTNTDEDPNGPWMTSSYVNPATKDKRPNLVYSIDRPNGEGSVSHPTHAWKYSVEESKQHQKDKRLWWGEGGDALYPRLKLYLKDAKEMVPVDLWSYKEVGSSDEGSGILKEIFGSAVFDNPKPVRLIEKVIKLTGNSNSIVLDSFAGSGTTAHAVQALNAEDGGNRKFILIETENYADTITAERVRRVMNGVPKAKDEALQNGLGGSFTYCELGDPIDMDSFFDDSKKMPPYDQLARYIAYTATGEALSKAPDKPKADWFIGEVGGVRLHLIYKPKTAFMRGSDAALNIETARAIAKSNATGKPVYVFAAAKYMGQKELTSDFGITFCQLPFAIHRIMGDSVDG